MAPFAQGPVNVPTLVENENDLLNKFGQPYATDKHYENWFTASSYAYGGSVRVVRSDNSMLKNGFVGTAASVKINSIEHYNELGYDENTLAGVTFAAKNPGTWANGARVTLLTDLLIKQSLVFRQHLMFPASQLVWVLPKQLLQFLPELVQLQF